MSEPARTPAQEAELAWILSTRTIRAQAARMLARAEDGTTHFLVRTERLDEAASLVAQVTRRNYPTLQIPFHSRWGHFRAGGVDRVAELEHRLAGLDGRNRARIKIELVLTSVMLDAGAGMAWRYNERESGDVFSRSEGLAVASFRMFMGSAFSSDKGNGFQADGPGLRAVTRRRLEEEFQVTEQNPLVGVEGRLALLHGLGRVAGRGRLGDVILDELDHLTGESGTQVVRATQVLEIVQRRLGTIWPGREELHGLNLGDVWRYPPFGEGVDGLVPFHKLSQWLTYSLLESCEEAGFEVSGAEEMTGLPEYRNGGLFLDLGVIELRDPALAAVAHSPGSELVVEWRALTVALLDRIAGPVRSLLGVRAEDFPLGKVLEGGTWWAGRQLAQERRSDGGSPLKIQSDGTVF